MNLTPNKKGIITIDKNDYDKSLNLNNLSHKKIKKIVINGNNNGDTIIASNYSDIITTGTGPDFITSGLGNDYVYGNDSGCKTLYFYKGDGNDKLYAIKKDDNIILNISGSSYNDIKYERNGYDLVITYIPQEKIGNKITQKSDSITLIDFFKNDKEKNINSLTFKVNNESKSVTLSELQYYITGKKVINGTEYNDLINGSKNKDTIYSKNGSDIVTAGKGNDNIYIDGNGEKTINIANGDGNDTIYIQNDNADINLIIDENDLLSYKKTDESIILYRTYEHNSRITTEKTTINTENFKINDDTFENLNLSNNFIQGSSTNANHNLINASDKNAVITGGNKKDRIYSGTCTNDVIFAGSGNDEIYLQKGLYQVYSGKGNDKITVSDGISNLYFKNGEGNDTLIIGQDVIDKYIINNEDIYSGDFILNLYFESSATLSYRTNGNDLFIDKIYKSGNKNITETLTIQNMCLDKTDIFTNKISIVTENGSLLLKNILEGQNIPIVGKHDNKLKITSYTGIKNLSNSIIYSTSGNADITGGIKDDLYTINTYNKKTGVIKIDDTDGEDTLSINTNGQNLRIMFNLDKDGNIVQNNSSDDKYWYNSLLLFDKSKLNISNYNNINSNQKGVVNAKDVIAINNYFATYDGNGNINGVNINSSTIEHIKDNSGQDLIISTAVQTVANRVSEMLKNKNDSTRINFSCEFTKDYESVYEILETGTNKEKNALLNVYRNTIIGTDGNESFISTNNPPGNAWASTVGNDIFISGKGDDTFTFSGKYGYDIIVSDTELNNDGTAKNTKTLIFKDYSLINGTLKFGLDNYNDLSVSAYYRDKGQNEGYQEEAAIYKNFFDPQPYYDENLHSWVEPKTIRPKLKIQDKTSTYEVDYRHIHEKNYETTLENETQNNNNVNLLILDNETQDFNWDNRNKNSIISSSTGYNIIYTNMHIYYAGADTDFHYIGGHDKYESLSQDNNSDNYYIDKFDTTTDLVIYDWEGDDSVIFSNTNIDDLRIVFNVYKDGTYGFDGNYENYVKDCTTLSLLNKDSFNMTDTTKMMKNQQRLGMMQINDFFRLDYNVEYNEETNSWITIPDGTLLTIETFKAKDNDGNINEIDMTKWIESISADVAQWLTKNNYATTYDAIDRAKPTKLTELLNIYNIDYSTAINKNN